MKNHNVREAVPGDPCKKDASAKTQPGKKNRRLDFLQGEQFVVPDDFDEFGKEEIQKIFGLKE